MSAVAPAPVTVPSVPPSGPAATLPGPRSGELHETGSVRKDSVDIERWTARGLVKVTGDVRVVSASLEGAASIGGKVTATALDYRGTVDLEGAVDVRGALHGAGSLRAALALHAGEAQLQGTARLGGALSVDRTFAMRGSLAAPSVAAGSFDLHGEGQVPGELTAASVTARLTSSSAFGNVRAKSVTLRARTPNFVEKIFDRLVRVTVNRVEADSAELEAVDVKFVRAPQIVLGRNAHVTEYEGTIVRRHPTSRVGFESRSPPPYGLSR